MKTLLMSTRFFAAVLFLGALLFAHPQDAAAHCDTMDGPVVSEAQDALETGDVEPVLKWVTADDETEVTALFEQTLRVREAGGEARELADMYFFETVVRLHRASEGVAYTGLKPAGEVDPAIAAADEALETGSVDELSTMLVESLQHALEERFTHAFEAKQYADETVEAGREFVHAYVLFTHLAEELHTLIDHASEAHTEAQHSHPPASHNH